MLNVKHCNDLSHGRLVRTNGKRTSIDTGVPAQHTHLLDQLALFRDPADVLWGFHLSRNNLSAAESSKPDRSFASGVQELKRRDALELNATREYSSGGRHILKE